MMKLFLSSVLATMGFLQQAHAQDSVVAWETELVEAWRTIGDCSPDTGICSACGFGAAVVDLNGENGTEIRTYNVGPGDLEAPW